MDKRVWLQIIGTLGAFFVGWSVPAFMFRGSTEGIITVVIGVVLIAVSVYFRVQDMKRRYAAVNRSEQK